MMGEKERKPKGNNHKINIFCESWCRYTCAVCTLHSKRCACALFEWTRACRAKIVWPCAKTSPRTRPHSLRTLRKTSTGPITGSAQRLLYTCNALSAPHSCLRLKKTEKSFLWYFSSIISCRMYSILTLMYTIVLDVHEIPSRLSNH